jgi:hypothetical protein
MKSLVAKRSIVAAGHKTSVSLEDAFWEGLKEIARGQNITYCLSTASGGKSPQSFGPCGAAAGRDSEILALRSWGALCRNAAVRRHERSPPAPSCNTVGGRIGRSSAVTAARSRAATMTNFARSSLALVLRALIGGAKSCALVNLFMICPRWLAGG